MFVLMISLISVQWVSGQTVTMNPTTASICAGSGTIVTFTAVPTGGAINYAWSNGITGIDYIDVSPLINTTYTVTVTFIGGVTATATGSVTVLPSPVPTISTSGPTTFCAGGNTILNSSITGTVTNYQWKLNGGTISGATNATYAATISGNYTLEVSNSNCSVTSTTTVVTVKPLPIVTVTPLANDTVTICNGSSTTLATNTGTGYTYQWQSSSTIHPGTWTNVPSNGSSDIYIATIQQWYRVQVSLNGCTVNSNW